MERQSKEESQVLWKLELDSAEKLTLTPEHQKLIDLVTKKIEDYSLTYYEYVEDIAAYLYQLPHDVDPKEAIKTINTGYHTNYTDVSNNIKEVKHSVILNVEEKKELEEKIVDELYRIFTHKAS